jgi:hypothetical protein
MRTNNSKSLSSETKELEKKLIEKFGAEEFAKARENSKERQNIKMANNCDSNNCKTLQDMTELPAVVYPKAKIDILQNELFEMKEQIKNGERSVFVNIEKLIEELEK